ncbi:MAG TPA: hypothetical protein VIZ60_13170, partial [Rubrobacter sp.]
RAGQQEPGNPHRGDRPQAQGHPVRAWAARVAGLGSYVLSAFPSFTPRRGGPTSEEGVEMRGTVGLVITVVVIVVVVILVLQFI